MRTSKSILAGVAAGALGLALVPFVGVSSAQAAGTVEGTVTPVRYTASSGFDANVPPAAIVFPKTANALAGTPSIYFDGTTAAGGQMQVYTGLPNTAAAGTTLSVTDDTLLVGTAIDNVLGDDSAVYVKVNAAGRYTGKIANGSDTVTFDFTTAGAPASISLSPSTQSVLVGKTAEISVALLDASGNPTQPSTVSNLTFAGSDTTNFSVTPASADYTTDSNALSFGALVVDDASSAAGSDTVTATGGGDLLGLSATATVTASGTVSDDTVSWLSLDCDSGCWNATPSRNSEGNWTAQYKGGAFTTLVVGIDDTTGNTSPLRFKIEPSVGSVTVGSDVATSGSPIYVGAPAGDSFITMTLGGAAPLTGSSITVKQVNVNDAVVPESILTMTAVNPSTQPTATVTPQGSIVTKIGDSIPVSVSYDDSFGDPISGQFIGGFLGSISAANLVSSGVTDSSGMVDLSVACSTCTTNGSTATFLFSTTTSSADDLSQNLNATYSTDGKITTLSVAPSTGSTFDAADATVTTLPVTTVVDTSGVVAGSTSAGVYTLSSSSVTTAPTTSLVSFAITTNPGNPATVTVPEGVKVSATNPGSTSTNWDGGAQSATISSGGTAYVWATKTGTHEVTVTSGGLTATGQLVVVNSSDDAYNIALSPSSQSVAAGSIGTVDLVVTDVFGNPVQTTDDTGMVTITASGEVILAGFETSKSFTTDANGVASVTIIAGNSGTGTLTAGPKSGDAAPAWQTGYTAPTNAPDPTTSAAATVLVSESSVKTITITGERGTVKGKPGIMVDGITTGFDEGAAMVPYIKFPGETAYSEGTARPKVDADGEFYWQRKTGKKIYVYFKNEDGTVKSERIIIQAK